MNKNSIYSEFFSLGKIPLVNNLNSSFEESINCERYELSIGVSDDGLVRIIDVVDTKLMFDKYLYLSGTSVPYIAHCEEMIKSLQKKINLEDGDWIVDIGGNDATLLKTFKKNTQENLKFLNVEPSDVVSYIDDNDIEIINSYFNDESVSLIDEKKAKIVTTTNVFQHLLEIDSFTSNIKKILRGDGLWCLEFPYWLESMKTLQFDQIYHEHIYYYNIKPLYNLFLKHGLKIIEISQQTIHGGSLRLLISHIDSIYRINESVDKFLKEEEEFDRKEYDKWSDKVRNHVENCKLKITEISKTKKVAVFGAAAKGCVFLNYSGIDFKNLSYIIDDTIIKQGKYMPGTGLKIYSRQIILEESPDYILILAHNFKDYIINSLREFGYNNKFIICLPEFEII